MRYYLDLVKIIARYEIIIAWYEIIKTCYAKIITLYALLQRNNAIFITRNAIIKFEHVILTRDKNHLSRENTKISRDINFSLNFSRDNGICDKTRIIYHVILAFISHDIEPDVCIRDFSFIFEVDFEEMAAFVSILRTDLTLLMSLSSNKKCVLNEMFGYHPHPTDIIETTKITTIAIDKRYRILQMCLLVCSLQTSNSIIRTHNLSCEYGITY